MIRIKEYPGSSAVPFAGPPTAAKYGGLNGISPEASMLEMFDSALYV